MVQSFLQFGERLVSAGVVRFEQLERALAHQRQSGSLLGESLVELGMLTSDQLVEQLSEHFGVPHIALDAFDLDPELVDSFPAEIARRHNAVPLFRDEQTLALAMVNPNDILSIEELERELGASVEVFFSQPEEISAAIHRSYGGDDVQRQELADLSAEYESTGTPLDSLEGDAGLLSLSIAGEAGDSGSPIIRAVNVILAEAIQRRATDVHIEPGEDYLRVRYRIDGFLREVPSPSKRLHEAIVSRIKVISNLDISETRLPQDGHFKCSIEGRTVEIRTSIVPTVVGENVVLRVLDKQDNVGDFGALGLIGRERAQFEEALSAPWGMVLVTGPTGSGKTTTLYSALHSINDPRRNVVTIEDPVETVLAGARQIQVNAKSGLDFARGLRAVLRHDPDIVMVGEIRDGETAEIATQAALTGHLILATLHTNDAPSAVARMVDLGVAPFLVEGSLSAVLAQRLVRKLCDDCKQTCVVDPSTDESARWCGAEEAFDAYRPSGCNRCENSGYRGRTGIHELMVLDSELREKITAGVHTSGLRKAAIAGGMRQLRDTGLDKVRMGITSLEEIVRVTRAH